nr:transposase [Paraburkholderia sp. Ac-20347]
MALRGISLLTAVTVVAELGDLTRFAGPPQLMAYLGLVPSEHSSGKRERRGGITKAGNGHLRRVLIEAAWTYRHAARKTAILQRRAERTAPEVQEQYRIFGIEPKIINILACKGINYFHADFEPIARELVFVDTGGLVAVDFKKFPFKNVRRPIWPLDPDVTI